MNKKPVDKRASKARKKFAVPQWMDEDLKLQAQWLDTLQRHTLAEKLERHAEQLRELKQPAVKWEAHVEVPLRPNVKRAVLAFAKHHGADAKESEQFRMKVGIQWFLESALPLIVIVSKNAIQQIRYRDAEGLEDSVLSERLIGEALLKYEMWANSQDD